MPTVVKKNLITRHNVALKLTVGMHHPNSHTFEPNPENIAAPSKTELYVDGSVNTFHTINKLLLTVPGTFCLPNLMLIVRNLKLVFCATSSMHLVTCQRVRALEQC